MSGAEGREITMEELRHQVRLTRPALLATHSVQPDSSSSSSSSGETAFCAGQRLQKLPAKAAVHYAYDSRLTLIPVHLRPSGTSAAIATPAAGVGSKDGKWDDCSIVVVTIC